MITYCGIPVNPQPLCCDGHAHARDCFPNSPGWGFGGYFYLGGTSLTPLTEKENTMKKSIDFTKPIQTRDGRKVRYLHTLEGDNEYRVVSICVAKEDGQEEIVRHTLAGGYYDDEEESQNDLVNVPEKKTLWVNIYPGTNLGVTGVVAHGSRGQADAHGSPSRVACVQVEYIEGQGL